MGPLRIEAGRPVSVILPLLTGLARLAEIGSESVGVKKEQSILMPLFPIGLPRRAVIGQDVRMPRRGRVVDDHGGDDARS